MKWIVNILSNYLRFLINMVVVFLMTPFIIGHIGQELFGLWSIIFAVVAIFGLLDMGFATAAVKYVGEYWASGETDKLEDSLGTLLLVYLLLGIICFLGAWNVAPVVASSYQFSPEQQAQFTLILRMIGGVVALSFPLSLYRSLLTGSGYMSVVNMSDLFFALLNALLAYQLLEAGYGINGLAISTAATMLGSFIAFIPLSRLRCPRVRITPFRFTRSGLGTLLSFSVYAFIANIAMMVIMRIDPLVIGSFLTLSDAAVFAIAAKIAEYSYFLNKQFSNALMPLISQQNGAKDQAGILRLLKDGSRFLLALAVPFCLLLFYFAPDLILLWVGDQFAMAGALLRILLVGVLAAAVLLLPSNVLAICGRHKYIAAVMIASAITNLTLSIFLVQKYGLTGVALGTLIATLLIECLFIFPAACRAMGMPLLSYTREVLFPILLPVVPMLIVVDQCYRLLDTLSLLAVVVSGALGALIYFGIFYRFGTRREERVLLSSRLTRWRSSSYSAG